MAWACILEVVEVVAVSSVEPACKRASLVEEDEELEAEVCTKNVIKYYHTVIHCNSRRG